MKFINTRKFTWIICIIGFLLALVSIFFLPSIIPVHFANGIADDYGRKIQIFLFPILQVLITFLTGREKVKYCLTHSKTFLTDIQFNWMIGSNEKAIGNHSRNFRNCIGSHWHCTEAERKHSRFCYWWCGWPDFYFHSREVKW